jgi:hypothetical protein
MGNGPIGFHCDCSGSHTLRIFRVWCSNKVDVQIHFQAMILVSVIQLKFEKLVLWGQSVDTANVHNGRSVVPTYGPMIAGPQVQLTLHISIK